MLVRFVALKMPPPSVAAAAIPAMMVEIAAIPNVLTADRLKTEPSIEPINLLGTQGRIQSDDLTL